MGRGEVLPVCSECWNHSVDARRAERKQALAKYWTNVRAEQNAAMDTVGAYIGQRVSYFAPSMLGAYFGGVTLRGVIRRNRNGVAVVKLDRPFDGKRQAPWSKGWTPCAD